MRMKKIVMFGIGVALAGVSLLMGGCEADMVKPFVDRVVKQDTATLKAVNIGLDYYCMAPAEARLVLRSRYDDRVQINCEE